MQNPKKVTLQRPGKLYTTIYHSGSINHSGTAKKLDSQAQITCHSPVPMAGNTVYFQFYDTAKTDYIATVCKGVDWERLAIVVVKIEAEFVSQIKGDDHIAGRTRIVKIGNKSFHLEQDVIDTDTQEVKSERARWQLHPLRLQVIKR